jgi:hypothetical protein
MALVAPVLVALVREAEVLVAVLLWLSTLRR